MPDCGTPVAVKAGDALVVGTDVKGIWKIDENARRHVDFGVA
jgi:uncharacterized protein